MTAPQVRGRDTFGVAKDFLETQHGELGCRYCHKGKNVDDEDEAHVGLVKDPSEEGGGGVCKECHEDITSTFKDSMHYTLNGIMDIVLTISKPNKIEDTLLPAAWKLDCNECHTSCGSCHVAWPHVAKGGLIDRHRFLKKPPMEKTCYACHGSRYAGEYMGLLGETADVHYEKLQMDCVDCHKGEQLHNTQPKGVKRHYATTTPRCEDCHPDAKPGNSRVAMHNAHEENELACTVCHSNTYFNCQNCHVSLDVKEKGEIKVIFPSDPLYTFKIGRNIDIQPGNPYKYNLVRHTPMLKDSLASLRYFQFTITGKPGPEDLIANWDALPTWNSANPHNVQKRTPQNRSCNSCHGVKELFLTKDDIKPEDPKANYKVAVDKVPPRIEE